MPRRDSQWSPGEARRHFSGWTELPSSCKPPFRRAALKTPPLRWAEVAAFRFDTREMIRGEHACERANLWPVHAAHRHRVFVGRLPRAAHGKFHAVLGTAA